MLCIGHLIAQRVGGADIFFSLQVGGILLQLFRAGQNAAEQVAAVTTGFVKGHRIFLLQIPVIISSYQGAGDAAVFVRLPGLQGNAVGGPVRRRQHNILRKLPPLGNAGQQALDGVLLELFVHLGAVGSRHNVSRRGRAFKSQRSPFFLSVFPGSQLAVTQLPLEGRMPIDDVVHQAGALQLPIVANRQPSRRCGVQDDHTDFTVRCQDSSVSLHNFVKRRGKFLPRPGNPLNHAVNALLEVFLLVQVVSICVLCVLAVVSSLCFRIPLIRLAACAPLLAVVIFLHAIHTLQAFAAAGNEVAGIGLNRRDGLVLGSPNQDGLAAVLHSLPPYQPAQRAVCLLRCLVPDGERLLRSAEPAAEGKIVFVIAGNQFRPVGSISDFVGTQQRNRHLFALHITHPDIFQGGKIIAGIAVPDRRVLRKIFAAHPKADKGFKLVAVCQRVENFGRLLLFAVPLFEQVALLIRKEDPLVDQIPD